MLSSMSVGGALTGSQYKNSGSAWTEMADICKQQTINVWGLFLAVNSLLFGDKLLREGFVLKDQ